MFTNIYSDRGFLMATWKIPRPHLLQEGDILAIQQERVSGKTFLGRFVVSSFCPSQQHQGVYEIAVVRYPATETQLLNAIPENEPEWQDYENDEAEEDY